MNYPDSKDKRSFQSGLEYQDFIMDKVLEELGIFIQVYSSQKYQYKKGESRQKIEIKLDRRCTETGRLSIEVEERPNKQSPWFDGGIMRKDNTVFYIQGNYDTYWIFFKHHLLWIYNQGVDVQTKDTVKTFYLDISRADKWGHRVDIK